MLALEHLFMPFGLNLTSERQRAKLVRHQDAHVDVDDLYRRGLFETYQTFQSKPRFANCDLVISFIGRPGLEAMFVGVYKVGEASAPGAKQAPPEVLDPGRDASHDVHYKLVKDPRFDELQGRLVIDWGASTRAWVQNVRPNTKRVVEVLPKGYVREFPGFLDFTLYFDELVAIIQNPAAHREWHRMLGSVAGVYLILDTRTGLQYIGSAYGQKGILGRWTTYATNGHGGNAQLRELGLASVDTKRHLKFSVLQTLPLTLTAREVISYEVRHKEKLGSRAHGLNSN